MTAIKHEWKYGTRRSVPLIGELAIKFPRVKDDLGRQCNQREGKIWTEAAGYNRRKLCEVLWCHPSGDMLVMRRTKPMTVKERDDYRVKDPELFLWDPEPSGNSAILEDKPEDLGWLNGEMKILDYGEPPSTCLNHLRP